MSISRKLALVTAVLAMFFFVTPAEADELDYRVEIRNTSGSALSGVPVTFAHPFLRGDIAAGQNLGVRIVGSDTLIDAQVNKKASHRDGSLRHAVVSLVLPSLAANQSVALELIPASSSLSGPAVSLPSLVGSGQTMQVDLVIGGESYRATMAEALESPISQWLSGPVASEWITQTPFRRVSDGQVHSDLKARFYARKYAGTNNVKVDVVVENTTTFVGVRQRFDYAAEIRINGNVVYSKEDIKHFTNTRWKYTFWTLGEPPTHIRFDPATLMATKAVPNYDPSLIWDMTNQSDRSDYHGSSYIDHGNGHIIDRYGPMGRGGNNTNNMSSTGGRGEIAPLPNWAAQWVLIQTPGTWRATFRNSDLAGSWGIHFRDENTGRPVTIDEAYGGYPRWGADPVPVSSISGSGTPLSHDTAHQPQFSFVPYLVTGDFFHFEELEFWSAYNLYEANPGTIAEVNTAEADGYRNHHKGFIINRGQLRARAWNLRTLAMTAAFAPDDYYTKQYWVQILNNNTERFYQRFSPNIAWGYAQHPGGYNPWMDDYMTWAAAYTLDLGYESARPAAEWKALFPVARMGKGFPNSQWCWQDGAGYSWGYYENQGTPQESYYATINDLWAAWRPAAQGLTCNTQAMANALGLSGPGDMSGRPGSSTSYVAQMGMALAAAVDLQIEGADAAWDIYSGATGERQVFPDFRGSPQFAIVPRSYRLVLSSGPKPPLAVTVQ